MKTKPAIQRWRSYWAEGIAVKNDQTGGIKYDDRKLRVDLIPPEAIEALARIYTYGTDGKPASPEYPGKPTPYAERNWEKGMNWGRVFGALQRHIWAFWRGEDIDPESGFPHVEHALWNAAALVTYQLRKAGTDDRTRKIDPCWADQECDTCKRRLRPGERFVLVDDEERFRSSQQFCPECYEIYREEISKGTI